MPPRVSWLENLLAVTTLFLFVFGIPFYSMPFNSSKLAVIIMLASVCLRHGASSKTVFLNKNILEIFFFLAAITLISSIFPVIHATNDFAITYQYFIYLAESFFGATLYFILFLRNRPLKRLIYYIIAVSTIQALIVISMLSNSTLREFIFSATDTEARSLFERYGGFRGLGLAGSLTYDFSVMLSISMILSAFLLTTHKENGLFLLTSWFFLFCAVAITGRTGLIGATLSLVLFLRAFTSKYAMISSIKFLIFMLGVSSVVLVVINTLAIDLLSTITERILPFVLEFFIQYKTSGEFRTYSTDALINMYFPIPLDTLIFGDGHFSSPDGFGYYMGTDGGYMRHILYYGLIPSAALYCFYLYGFLAIKRYNKRIPGFGMTILLILFYYFIVHYKGNFLTGSGMNIKIFLLFLVYSIMSRERFKHEESCLRGKYAPEIRPDQPVVQFNKIP